MPPFEGISFSLGAEFNGKTLPKTRKDLLIVFFNNEKAAIVHKILPSLIFLADNKRIKLENKVFFPDEESKPSQIQIIAYAVTLANLRQLALSKIIEGQLGEKEFVLTKKQVQLVKELYFALVPKPTK